MTDDFAITAAFFFLAVKASKSERPVTEFRVDLGMNESACDLASGASLVFDRRSFLLTAAAVPGLAGDTSLLKGILTL